jgi:hypothetical protein
MPKFMKSERMGRRDGVMGRNCSEDLSGYHLLVGKTGNGREENGELEKRKII